MSIFQKLINKNYIKKNECINLFFNDIFIFLKIKNPIWLLYFLVDIWHQSFPTLYINPFSLYPKTWNSIPILKKKFFLGQLLFRTARIIRSKNFGMLLFFANLGEFLCLIFIKKGRCYYFGQLEWQGQKICRGLLFCVVWDIASFPPLYRTFPISYAYYFPFLYKIRKDLYMVGKDLYMMGKYLYMRLERISYTHYFF